MIGSSHIGRRRKVNQDSIYYDASSGLGIVADGIGGRKGGEIASSMAVDFVRKAYEKLESNDAMGSFLTDMIVQANNMVIKKGNDSETYKGMGTTMNCIAFNANKVHIAHIGDSRTYLFYKNNLWQLTMDHNVYEFVKRGWLDPEILQQNSKKDALVRAIGLIDNIECDIYDMELIPDSMFLTCSDGLTGMVTEKRICEIMNSTKKIERLPSLLIDEANLKGGVDNITVLISHLADK